MGRSMVRPVGDPRVTLVTPYTSPRTSCPLGHAKGIGSASTRIPTLIGSTGRARALSLSSAMSIWAQQLHLRGSPWQSQQSGASILFHASPHHHQLHHQIRRLLSWTLPFPRHLKILCHLTTLRQPQHPPKLTHLYQKKLHPYSEGLRAPRNPRALCVIFKRV